MKGFTSGTTSKKGRWADKEAQSLGVGRVCNSSELISTGSYRWVAFVFLYEMLEEYGTHLVEAAWNHQVCSPHSIFGWNVVPIWFNICCVNFSSFLSKDLVLYFLK